LNVNVVKKPPNISKSLNFQKNIPINGKKNKDTAFKKISCKSFDQYTNKEQNKEENEDEDNFYEPKNSGKKLIILNFSNSNAKNLNPSMTNRHNTIQIQIDLMSVITNSYRDNTTNRSSSSHRRALSLKYVIPCTHLK
jgi:hypothetical protein